MRVELYQARILEVMGRFVEGFHGLCVGLVCVLVCLGLSVVAVGSLMLSYMVGLVLCL